MGNRKIVLHGLYCIAIENIGLEKFVLQYTSCIAGWEEKFVLQEEVYCRKTVLQYSLMGLELYCKGLVRRLGHNTKFCIATVGWARRWAGALGVLALGTQPGRTGWPWAVHSVHSAYFRSVLTRYCS